MPPNFKGIKAMIKNLIPLFFFSIMLSQASAQQVYPDIVIETNYGKMTLALYDNTPMHSDNFVKLVKEGYYNEQLFHRVINNFMIQAGDPNSVNAKPGVMLGTGGPSYTIPAEFVPEYYHKKGAISAARQGDNVNPNKESSGSQFYIVQGKTYSRPELEQWVKRGAHLPFSKEQIQEYSTLGGTPHLDYSYTVFGELIDGLDILDIIASQRVDQNNRPIADVKIIKMYTQKR